MIRRRLSTISTRMNELKKEDGDTQASHTIADDLLVELIMALVDDYGAYEDEVNKILLAYSKVDKWYA